MVLNVQPETWEHVDRVIEYAVQESAQILSRLRAVRAASDMISSASDTLHDLLEQIEQASCQSEVTGVLGDAGRSVHASAGALQDLNADDLTDHLRYSMRHMKELKFIAMMIKVDAAKQSRTNSKPTEFADDLAALVTLLDSTTQSAIDCVRPINDHIRNACQTLQNTAVGLTRQVKDIASQKDSATELQRARDTQLLALSKEARQIARDTAEQISLLIPRLQFADAFVQRLQNARRFVEQAKDHPETTTQDVLALAAQQFRSLCADTRAERQASTVALDVLLNAASQSSGLMSDGTQDDGFGAWLRANTSAVSLNTQVINTSHGQLLSAFQKIDDAQEDAIHVSEAISKFGPLVQALKFTAINGALMAAHSSSKAGASYVLTAEIQNIGKQCGQRMTNSTAALAHINDTLARVERSEIEDKIGQLANGLDVAKAAQGSLKRLTGDLHQSRQRLADGVNALLEACRDARQTIQDGEAMILDLECLIGSDTGMDTMGIASADVLWITEFYTTEPERALHQLLFGGETVQAAVSPELDDDLADFML